MQIRIECRQPLPRCQRLAAADVGGGVQHLPLQVGDIDGIEVDKPQRANTRCCEIQCRRRAQPARTDDQYPRGFEFFLACGAHFDEYQMTPVAFAILCCE